MDRLQFTFKMLPATDDKSNVLCVIRITTSDGRTYKIPHENLNALIHTELIKMPSFAKVKKSIKQRGQMRKVWINLTKELENIYYDEDGNIQLDGEYLEEIIEKQENSDILAHASEQPLVNYGKNYLKKANKNYKREIQENQLKNLQSKNLTVKIQTQFNG